MSAQTWKTHWATIDQARDPQRYVGQMSAMRKEADDTVPGPFLEFCDLQVGQWTGLACGRRLTRGRPDRSRGGRGP